MKAKQKTGRELFRPKFPEVEQQCPSCPFLEGNDKEFGAVVARLRKQQGIEGKPAKRDIGWARISIMCDAQGSGGNFMCHCSVYDRDMWVRPMKEWRQCAGATKAYRNSLPGS